MMPWLWASKAGEKGAGFGTGLDGWWGNGKKPLDCAFLGIIMVSVSLVVLMNQWTCHAYDDRVRGLCVVCRGKFRRCEAARLRTQGCHHRKTRLHVPNEWVRFSPFGDVTVCGVCLI
jgi:hypothetical protein